MNNKNTISDKLKKVKAQYSYVEIAKRFETREPRQLCKSNENGSADCGLFAL